jgi:hypothetical protein
MAVQAPPGRVENVLKMVVFLSLCIVPQSVGASTPGQRLGGPCEYKSYHGTAEVLSVVRIRSGHRTEEDQYEIKCHFQSLEEIGESFARNRAKEFLLLTENGENPGLAFMELHEIVPGKKLPCVLKAIVRGTCTPVLFEFPWTDRHGGNTAGNCALESVPEVTGAFVKKLYPCRA